MRRTLAAILVVGSLVAPAGAESLTLAKSYAVAGTNPDGSSYGGSLAVQVISDTTYTVRWSIGGSTYTGFGMRMNDTLSATYTLDGKPGLVMYQLQDGGVLKGIWAVRGNDGFGTETLTPK
ncbi:MAG: hypothetical protein HXX10_09365 [Rhodoplanes sp.]|uniref:hypothetical protein n=1 Tax=Rhodoplanes sp. TaxID=1968906 RepID=UPI0017A735D7|nr:hypothetical protein [Rhodoplanes sp.]NVO14230.1 hypothetical protein [Rhodoplanes sp.]